MKFSLRIRKGDAVIFQILMILFDLFF